MQRSPPAQLPALCPTLQHAPLQLALFLLPQHLGCHCGTSFSEIWQPGRSVLLHQAGEPAALPLLLLLLHLGCRCGTCACKIWLQFGCNLLHQQQQEPLGLPLLLLPTHLGCYCGACACAGQHQHQHLLHQQQQTSLGDWLLLLQQGAVRICWPASARKEAICTVNALLNAQLSNALPAVPARSVEAANWSV